MRALLRVSANASGLGRYRRALYRGPSRLTVSRFRIGCLRDQGRDAARWLEIGNELRSYYGGLHKEPAESGGVDAPGTRHVDPEATHVFEPIEQRERIGWCRRLRGQRGEAEHCAFAISGLIKPREYRRDGPDGAAEPQDGD
ncbi:MAG: hypothetical protein ACREFP_26525 [Acetobacteraceae bacterium]